MIAPTKAERGALCGDRGGRTRTRFAPSPTGELHVGGAWVALASWVMARAAGGTFIVRMENLDRARVVPDASERILSDLRWLGLDWDEGPDISGPFAPYTQSERARLYEAALSALSAAGHTYACDCSRTDIARLASAPHAGEEVVYPGVCRDAPADRALRRSPALRLRISRATRVVFDDGVMGRQVQTPAAEVGDFVLRRADGVYAYQLAVVVDDLAMRVTDVVRGADLLGSTPRQMLLARLLGGAPPRYWHLPLVTSPDGSRLAKRLRGAAVGGLRAMHLAPERIVGQMAHALGITPSAAPATAHEVAEYARRGGPIAWRRTPWPIPAEWARA